MNCCSVKMFALLLVLLAVASANERDPRFFHSKQFWDGFESGLSEMGAEVQKHLNSNTETAMSHIFNFRDTIDTMYEQTLPSWMNNNNRRTGESYDSEKPIRAIVGNFGGDGLDDGLQVYFAGDEDAETLQPQGTDERVSVVDQVPTMAQPSDTDGHPNIGGPFEMGMPWSHTFPHFPMLRRPFNPWGVTRRRPWWSGENVCVDEVVIDEPEKTQESVVAEAEADVDINIRVAEKGEAEAGTDDGLFSEKEAEQEEAIAAGTGRGFSFGTVQMKSCREENDKYICVTRTRRRGVNKSVRTTKRCCHGYVKEATGCTKVNMVPLAESLKGLELTGLLSLVRSSGEEHLINSQNLTIFAPITQAIEDYTDDLTEQNNVDITENEVISTQHNSVHDSPRTMVVTHMTEGFVYTGDMKDEQILPSLLDGSSIRINIYRSHSTPIVTANCAKVIIANQHSSNGVIHTLDSVMRPAQSSIAHIISNDPQFVTLNKLIRKAGLYELLNEPGQMTLFAPTNAAFDAISSDEYDLMGEAACLAAVIRNHLLPNVICSAAITNPEAKTMNMLKKYLKLTFNQFGDKLYVEDAQIVAKDVVATNGVIHIIDAPLIPQESKPVIDVLKQQNLTSFINLLQTADMMEEMSNLTDVTILVPDNSAVDNFLLEELAQYKADMEPLRNIIRNHIVSTPLSLPHVSNNQMVDTMSGNPLRLNLYSSASFLDLLSPGSRSMRVTAGCGVVTNTNSQSCGTTIHVIDRLITMNAPAHAGGWLQQLENKEHFSIFNKIVKGSKIAKDLSEGPFTVLAPTDHVFRTLPKEELESLLTDDELREELLKRHLLREYVCCSGITSNGFPFSGNARTVHGDTLSLHRTSNGLIKAGSARITECGEPSTNGIIHTVNRLFVEPHIVAEEPPRNHWDAVRPLVLRLPSLSQTLFGGGH